MTKRPAWLLAGVGCFLLAIGIAVQAQLIFKEIDSGEDGIELNYHETTETSNETMLATMHPNYATTIDDFSGSSDAKDKLNATVPSNNLNDCSGFQRHHQDEKLSSLPVVQQPQQSTTVMTALVVTFLGGLAFGFFSPAFNVAVNDPFEWTTATTTTIDQDGNGTTKNETMRVARANLVFSFAFWLASFTGNFWLLKRQHAATSMLGLLRRYLCMSSFADRWMALAAGLVCAIGNVLQFQGGQLVGYATADLVQAYPLVSTVWDVLWFGEFRSLSWPYRMALLLFGMYMAYGAGVVLFAGSSVGAGS
jgi:Ureide permease